MQSLNNDGSIKFVPVGRDRRGRQTGKPSRGQRKMLAGSRRYRKDKRRPIMFKVTMENGRFYETWVHPTKGKRKVRKWA